MNCGTPGENRNRKESIVAPLETERINCGTPGKQKQKRMNCEAPGKQKQKIMNCVAHRENRN